MGFLSRALIPRGVRRAAHPVRTAKSAVTPRTVKQARRVLNPIDSAVYSAERALNTKPRKRRSNPAAMMMAVVMAVVMVVSILTMVFGLWVFLGGMFVLCLAIGASAPWWAD
jgi:hypothetical protein